MTCQKIEDKLLILHSRREKLQRITPRTLTAKGKVYGKMKNRYKNLTERKLFGSDGS